MSDRRTVAIITDTLPFQKYFCVELSKRQQVIGILHPGAGSVPTDSKLVRLTRKIRERGIHNLIPDQIKAFPYIAASRKHGYLSHFLHYLGINNRFGWDRQHATEEADAIYFNDSIGTFNKELSPIAKTFADINSTEAVNELTNLDAEVVICLGGPIYRRELIESARIMLNYHTGISPIYNGTGSIYWCFANQHVHLTGATLMVISPVIDGGDILGHYLPAIESEDTPATLFAKCIVGSVLMYDSFLNWYWENRSFARIPQGRPLYHLRGHHWNVTQNLAIERILKKGLVADYVRDESKYEYWKLDSQMSAESEMREAIMKLLFHT